MPTGKLIMMSKRKNEDELDDPRAKKQRRRKRSRSEPRYDTNNPEKREALKRLFGRFCTLEDNPQCRYESDESDDEFGEGDENEDPLLDTVPVNMDPEQLGFLVCAQETLRFLQERGLALEHPMLARLRRHFIRGIQHIAAA